MNGQKETEEEPTLKTRARIYTKTNRSERVAAIRRALSHKEGADFFTEDVNDLIMEEGCKAYEQKLGL